MEAPLVSLQCNTHSNSGDGGAPLRLLQRPDGAVCQPLAIGASPTPSSRGQVAKKQSPAHAITTTITHRKRLVGVSLACPTSCTVEASLAGIQVPQARPTSLCSSSLAVSCVKPHRARRHSTEKGTGSHGPKDHHHHHHVSRGRGKAKIGLPAHKEGKFADAGAQLRAEQTSVVWKAKMQPAKTHV